METSNPTFTVSQSLMEALSSRGWCFKDADRVRAQISSQLSSSATVDSAESLLLNMDLRSIGGKSFPDLRRAAHLPGPKVLQVSSVRDVTKSNVDEITGNSSDKRLLKLKLTDGHSEIVAVEFSHIPAISDNIVCGTKIRLENKAMVRSGIVCLDAKVTRVLGGVVQSLYEEWQMDQKYAGFSRSSGRPSDETTAIRAPPFEKLQVGSSSLQLKSRSSVYARPSTDRSSTAHRVGESSTKPQSSSVPADIRKLDVQPKEGSVNAEARKAVPDARQKEVAEAVPIQNQAAAQKLLQKMNQPNHDNQHFRGRRHRRYDREDETAVLTLDEWERRKASGGTSTAQNAGNLSQDEILARQLQEQFDMEDSHVQEDPHVVDPAETIRMSMFNFQRDDTEAYGGTGHRGRGRSRGRGRGRRGGRSRGY